MIKINKIIKNIERIKNKINGKWSREVDLNTSRSLNTQPMIAAIISQTIQPFI